MVGKDDDKLARVRRLANHGRLSQTEHDEPGVNSRLDAIQAAALSIKLPHLSDWNAARGRVARWYDERLKGLKDLVLPVSPSGKTHVWHLYVVQSAERDRLRTVLQDQKIATGLHYPRAAAPAAGVQAPRPQQGQLPGVGGSGAAPRQPADVPRAE